MRRWVKRCGVEGFTLVEMVLALGLASTALLALVSLLVSGLASVAESSEMRMSSMIARTVGARVRQTEWELDSTMRVVVPKSLRGGRLLFDEHGVELSAEEEDGAAYEVMVEWEERAVVLPGATGAANVGGAGNPFNRMVLIRVKPWTGGVGTDGYMRREFVVCMRPIREGES